MELVAFVFHVSYVTCARGEDGTPRKLKWFEYGISATLGTIAVLHINAPIHYEWIILFFLIGSAQQTIGLLVDDNSDLTGVWWAFVAGCLIQVGEYAFVGIKAGISGPTYWTYVAFYGLFGVHALVGLLPVRPAYGDYMEEIYSLYGFMAKLAVFYAEYFDNVGMRPWVVGVTAAWFYLMTVLYTVVAFIRDSRTHNSLLPARSRA